MMRGVCSAALASAQFAAGLITGFDDGLTAMPTFVMIDTVFDQTARHDGKAFAVPTAALVQHALAMTASLDKAVPAYGQ